MRRGERPALSPAWDVELRDTLAKGWRDDATRRCDAGYACGVLTRVEARGGLAALDDGKAPSKGWRILGGWRR